MKNITLTDSQFVDLLIMSYRRGYDDAIGIAQEAMTSINDDDLKAQFLEIIRQVVGDSNSSIQVKTE